MKKMYMLLAAVLFMAITGCGSGGGGAVPPALSSEKAITAFDFAALPANGTVTEAAHTIAVTVPFGTDVTALIPTITISVGASISPDTGVANNFTTPQTYTVTAEDTTTQEYTVTVTIASGDYTSAYIGTLKHVPAGSFQRDGATASISTVATAFRMSQYEITRAQFLAVMGTDPSDTTISMGLNDPVQQANWYHAIAFCNKLSIAEGLTPVYSVAGVNFTTLTYGDIPTSSDAAWNAASANWAANGYRLPTEMEWMWAAMGATSDRSNGYTGTGTNTTGYTKGYAGSTETGGTQVNIDDYAWTWENATSTHQVGTAGHPNELGLYDISGNVWEWVWDRNGAYPAGTQTDYRGAASGTDRVVRGGSWNYFASFASVVFRNHFLPSDVHEGIGFRVVRP